MASNRVDWAVLRGSVILFALSLSVAAAMVSASFYFRQTMQREYDSNHARFRETSQRYLAVDDEERIIHDFYPDFVRLYRAGLLGHEHRLSWLESLRRAGDDIALPSLTYKLDAQREAQPDFPIALGGYALYMSAMNLGVGLAHEGDLLQLLALLERDAHGFYSLRSCALKRNSIDVDVGGRAANVNADCVLEWWTINRSSLDGIEL